MSLIKINIPLTPAALGMFAGTQVKSLKGGMQLHSVERLMCTLPCLSASAY